MIPFKDTTGEGVFANSAALSDGHIFGGEAKTKADAWIKEVNDTITEIKTAIGETNSEKAVYYVNGEKQKGLY